MPNKEWDEDPWDHIPSNFQSKPKSFTPTKSSSYGYQVATINATLSNQIREIVREEVTKSVQDAFQRIMDRLDELEEATTRER